jgi:hypothetical protein
MFKLNSPLVCVLRPNILSLAWHRQTHSKTKFLSFSMVATDWTTVSSNRSPPYLAFSKPIQKSQQDDRDYRLIHLGNGLRAMLVHDAKADKAAASLDVAVGHLSDPVSLVRIDCASISGLWSELGGFEIARGHPRRSGIVVDSSCEEILSQGSQVDVSGPN